MQAASAYLRITGDVQVEPNEQYAADSGQEEYLKLIARTDIPVKEWSVHVLISITIRPALAQIQYYILDTYGLPLI